MQTAAVVENDNYHKFEKYISTVEIYANSMAYGTWRFNAAFTRALQ